MRNVYLQIALFTGAVIIATLSVPALLHVHLPIISWFSLLFYVAMTVGIHAILSPYLYSKNKQFVVIFIGTLGIRMFSSIAFLLLYLLFSREHSLAFISYYLLLYLFYAGFEIYLLLSNLRADLKKGSKEE